MCLAVYIATSDPAPAIPWDSASPAFNAQPLTDIEHAVRARFRRKHVTYLGAYTGCSCGFSYGTLTASNTEADDVVAARASTEALRRYLERLLDSETEIELFACWEGDQTEPEIDRRIVGTEHFGGSEFEFVERELLVVILTAQTATSSP